MGRTRRTPTILSACLGLCVTVAGPVGAESQERAAVPPASPRQAPVEIVGFDVGGTEVDPRADIEALARSVAPRGSPYVAPGPADLVGAPVGTEARLRQAFASIGYDAIVGAAPAPGGVRLSIHLRPYDRIRRIYVSGNWPVRQDELQRRISIRPGQPLPLPGPERDQAVARERGRIVDFMRDEGYLEADARVYLLPKGTSPAAVDVLITVDLGPPFPIGRIRVTGNRILPADEIADQFRHVDWKMGFVPWRWQRRWPAPAPFDRRRLRLDRASALDLYKDKGYPAARIEVEPVTAASIDAARKDVSLGLVVNEHQHVLVDFEGNAHLSSRFLRKNITLFERGSDDDYELDASADSLHKAYQESGFLLCRVRWRRDRLGPGEEHVTFIIDEGPDLKVRGVDFEGNASFPAERLAEAVTVRPFPWLGVIGLGTGGFVTGRQIDLDIQRLKDFYRRHGFLDAQATGEAAPSPALFGRPGALAAAAETTARAARAIYVRYTVDEGARVLVASQTFEAAGGGPLPLDPAFLQSNLHLRPGQPFNPDELAADQARLVRLFGDDGYPDAAASPDATRRGNRVAVSWRIEPGPRVRIQSILIRGNFLTRPSTFLEWLPLRPGDLLTTTAFERGQRNLALTQLFDTMKITFPGRTEKRADVPMLITVEERHDHWGIATAGGGISTEQAPPGAAFGIGYFLSAGYEHRNLLGRGWHLLGQGSFGPSLVRANTTFEDQRFLHTLFRLQLAGNYLSQATVRLGDIQTGGGSVGFAREMAPGVDAAVRYNLRNTTHTEPLLRGAGPDEDQSTVQIGTAVGSLSLSIAWLRLDNRLVPTRGFKVDASLEIAEPPLSFAAGADSFVKAGAHATVVVPLLPWLWLRHGLRYDQGFPLGASVLPKVERFFAGGDTTIRGFDLDRARTEVIRSPVAPGIDAIQFLPIGGSLRLLQNIDLQFPIAPPLFGAVFLDNGVVADSFDGLSAAAFRHGAGVAPILLKLPIGDVQLGWGWPLDPGPGDSATGRLQVNIGLMF